MKILIISHMYLSTFDNITLFVPQQVRALREEGYEIKVISPLSWTPFPIKYLFKKWRKYSENPKKMIWDGIEVYYPRYLEFPRALFFASSGKRMYWGIKKAVAKMYKDFKFDIIHTHVALPDAYAGIFLAKKYKKPLIITIHGQDFQQTIYKNKRCREKIKKVINFSRKTIVVSNKLKNIGEKELKISPQKLITIPNGINVEDIYIKKSKLRDQYKEKKVVLSVSNLIKIKGIDYNLKAIAKLKEKYPEITYLIIGDGPERKNLEKLAKDLNISNIVEFLGRLPHKKTMEYMSICDIFSLPSWNEAFGVVYIEAMAHGKVIISCKKEGIGGIIQDKETGMLVDSKKLDSLIGAMNFLFLNPKKAKEIGEKAKKLVLENYTWEKIVKAIIEIYKQ